MRGKLNLVVSAIALTLIAAASLAAFVSELLGPRRISGLIAFASIFLMSLYPIAVVTAFWIYMILSARRSQRELARKQRGG
jgi:hypothetical protein